MQEKKKNKIHKIHYKAGPTGRHFHRSKAPYRLVRGPVGGGKTVMCCIDIFARACAQAPGPDGVRRSRWVMVRNCYDDKTEILTKDRSWQFFKDLTQEDLVATLVDGDVVYKRPESVYAAPYQGDMVGFESEGVNFLVTPDHKMHVSKVQTRKKIWGKYCVKTAEEIYGSTGYRVRRDANWPGEDTPHSVDFFKWLGFWFADGSAVVYDGNRHQCVITQDAGRYDPSELFTAADLPFTIADRPDKCKTYRLSVNEDTKPLIKELADLGKCPQFKVPLWVKKASAEHIGAFLDGFILGDGHKRKDSVTTTAYTSSKALADDLQEMALLAGRVANISSRDRTGQVVVHNGSKIKTNHPEYTVTFLSEKKYEPRLCVNPNHTNKLKGWYKEQYDGMVYCVEMPIVPVYVRRKGKAFWCYRTYPELKSTTIKTWLDWFPEDIFGRVKYDVPISQTVKTTAPDGTRVVLEVWWLALDRPQHVKKLLSLECTAIFFNEIREIPKAIVDAADSRVGRFPPRRKIDGIQYGASWWGVIGDTNAPDDDHWYYNLEIIEQPEGWDFFVQPPGVLEIGDGQYITNPKAENLKNLVPGYYQRQVQGKAKAYVRVYLMNKFGSTHDGRPIHPGFNEDLHMAKGSLLPMRGIPLLLGWDYGRTPACIICQPLPTGQFRVLRELFCEGTDIRQFARNVVIPELYQRFRGMRVKSVGDPSGGNKHETSNDTCMAILNEEGIPTHEGQSNEPVRRRDSLESYFSRLVNGQPAILIDPSCSMLRKGLGGAYCYKRLKVAGDERFHDMPDKNKWSHPCEALQYATLDVNSPMVESSIPVPPQIPATSSKGGY